MEMETSGIQPIPSGWQYQVLGSIWHMLQHYGRCRFSGRVEEGDGEAEASFRLEYGEDLSVGQSLFIQYKTNRGSTSTWSVSEIAKDILYHFARNWALTDRSNVQFRFVTDQLTDGFVALRNYIRKLRLGEDLSDINIPSPEDSRKRIPAERFAEDLLSVFRSRKEEESPVSTLTTDDVRSFLQAVYIEEPLTEGAALADITLLLQHHFVPQNVAESKVRELFAETYDRLCKGSGEFTGTELLASVGITGPISWDKISKFAELQREDQIRGIVDRRSLLDPCRAVPRADAEASFVRFLQSDKSVLLLSGPQGTGKTTLLIRLARECANTHAVVIRSVSDLSLASITSGLLEHMDYQPDLMTLPQILRKADQGAGAGMKLVVLGDGADETDLDRWRSILSDVASMVASNPDLPIKFCFSIRHEAWYAATKDLLTGYSRLFYAEQGDSSDPLDMLSVRLGDFAEHELDQALQEWNVESTALGPWRDLLRTPKYFGIYARISDEARVSVLAASPRPANLLRAYLHDRLQEVARHTNWDENALQLELVDLCSAFSPQLQSQSGISINEFRSSAVAAKWDYPNRSRNLVYGALVHSGLVHATGDAIRLMPDELVPYLLATASVGHLARLQDAAERCQRAVELVAKLDSSTDDVDYWLVALMVQMLEVRPDLANAYFAMVEALLQRWQLASFFGTIGPAAVRAICQLSRQGDASHWPAYSQAAALVAIGALPEVVAELLRRLDDDSDDERIQACRALACLKVPEAIVRIAKQYKTFNDSRDDHALTECLSRYGEEALDPLHWLAGDESLDTVHCAAYALSRIAHKRSMPVLRELAKHHSEHLEILSAALWGLARVADRETVELFRQAISSSDAIVARAGIWGMRATKDQDGALLLIDMIRDSNAAGQAFRGEAVSAIIDIPVTKADLVRYQVDFPKVFRGLCESAGFDYCLDGNLDLHEPVRFGSLVAGPVTVPVHFALASGGGISMKSLIELLVCSCEPMILFTVTPLTYHLNSRVPWYADSRLVISLADLFGIREGGRVGISKELHLAVEGFRMRSVRIHAAQGIFEAQQSAPPTSDFRQTDDYHNIWIRGKKLPTLSDMQADMVRVLYEALLNGETELRFAAIAARMKEPPGRFDNVFRYDDPRRAIVAVVRRGVFRLNTENTREVVVS